jgi:hypothetical protein
VTQSGSSIHEKIDCCSIRTDKRRWQFPFGNTVRSPDSWRLAELSTKLCPRNSGIAAICMPSSPRRDVAHDLSAQVTFRLATNFGPSVHETPVHKRP